MSREVQRQIAGFLVEKLDVIADANLYEALEAWSAMRDQRDRARAIAVELEQENAQLRQFLEIIEARVAAAGTYEAADGRTYTTPLATREYIRALAHAALWPVQS